MFCTVSFKCREINDFILIIKIIQHGLLKINVTESFVTGKSHCDKRIHDIAHGKTYIWNGSSFGTGMAALSGS